MDPDTARKYAASFDEHGKIVPEDTSKRGAGSASYVGLIGRIDPDVEAEIRADAEASLREKEPLHVTRLLVQSEFMEKQDLYVSLKRAGKLLARWDFDHGEIDPLPGGAPNPARELKQEIFVLQVDRAIKAKHHLYCIDESYANVRLNHTRGYAKKGEMKAAWVKGGGLGQRLCFIHAIGEDGLLCGPDGNVVSVALGDKATTAPTAELMFAAQKGGDTGDYHGNFDGDVFMDWTKNRFVPALRAKHPKAFGPKATEHVSVVVDNANYHHRRSKAAAGGVGGSLEAANRSEIIDKLKAAGCKKLSVTQRYTEKGVPVVKELEVAVNDAEKAAVGRAGSVARMWELRDAAFDWLINNKREALFNDFEAYLASQGNIHVIWAAPNWPQANLIELVWAQGSCTRPCATARRARSSSCGPTSATACTRTSLPRLGAHSCAAASSCAARTASARPPRRCSTTPGGARRRASVASSWTARCCAGAPCARSASCPASRPTP